MKTKPLNLLTMDTIQLNHCYTRATPDSNKATYVGAFGTTYVEKFYGHYFDKPKTTTTSDVAPKVIRSVKALGYTFEFDLVTKLDITLYDTIAEIREKYPKVADVIAKQYTNGWLEAYNQILIDERNKYTSKVDKLYQEMITIHTDLNYPGDLSTLAELDDLLYCEAEGFLLKMEEKINKKNNPKNLKLYKALQELRNKPIITCESA